MKCLLRRRDESVYECVCVWVEGEVVARMLVET